MENKIKKLKEILRKYESVIVAYSGGVDSTLLCYFANEVLEDKFIAITATSEVYTQEELEEATKIAHSFCWKHEVINTKDLDNKNFINNTTDKCKWCKDHRFKKLLEIAKNRGYKHLISGDNLDDLEDYRPGLKHAKTLGVKSPLIEAKLTKKEIRELAKKLGLPNYNKPSNPCLASRIPYGIEITEKALKMIEEAENFIKNLGYINVRVRHHDHMAKIEIEKAKIINFVSFHCDITTKKLKEIGYKYVTIDLEGYRMGSLNEVI